MPLALSTYTVSGGVPRHAPTVGGRVEGPELSEAAPALASMIGRLPHGVVLCMRGAAHRVALTVPLHRPRMQNKLGLTGDGGAVHHEGGGLAGEALLLRQGKQGGSAGHVC